MTGNMHKSLAEHTRFAQRVRRRYGSTLSMLAQGLPDAPAQRALYQALRAQGFAVGESLRITRQHVLERLLVLDCETALDLRAVTQCMTELAELALCEAYAQASSDVQAVHGQPCKADGSPSGLCILGMGKLGARELNVSSDIDLIYVYEADGDTDGNSEGRGRISNQEYYGKLVRALYALLGDMTEHGFVFRVDLALRPNGNSGPPAVSLGALEEYFQTQGREWERFAWLKSRVLAPQASVGSAFALQLRAVVTPFVFRKYLDYNVFDALRVLHRQIREHAGKRSAGHPERHNDVKLSRGGIREIEFTVQLLQVVRGGQFPELRTRPTLSALQRLVQAGLMPAEKAQALQAAYVFLRRVEHRIQYLDDQQTHVLPTGDADLAWIAETMGIASTSAFLAQLDHHRENVAQEFDVLLGGSDKACSSCKPVEANLAKPGATPLTDLDSVLTQLPPSMHERLALWRDHPRVLGLREESRGRLLRLVQRTGQWLHEGEISQDAALRLMDWMESLLRRESYLALLVERPGVHQRLLRLLGAARWPARYLLKHPGVIDELAGSTMVRERFDAAAFEADIERRCKALRNSGEEDDESLLNLLRRAHHAEVFRTLARDVEGLMTVEQVADDLSALAEAILRITVRWVWQRMQQRHCELPRIAIIAYGKLGGKELGYGGDLDIVFLYDDPDERAGEMYGTLVRKLINWLTVKTGEGDLYEIDTALRPNGSAGLLVTSFTAYADYQQQRGSNTAWTWEHQAMTRARCVLGSADLHSRFDAIREAVICSERGQSALRMEISAMRQKVRAAHPVPAERFDVKHSPGGMVDIEFAVQFMVLAHGHAHPGLRANVGNIALLQAAQDCGLLPAPLGYAAAKAYRMLRSIQHKARLNEDPTQVALAQAEQERQAGLAVWRAVFGD